MASNQMQHPIEGYNSSAVILLNISRQDDDHAPDVHGLSS
jgi:hypothetical protein